MQQISRCLNQQLISICNKAEVLKELDGHLQSYLPGSLKGHCRVGSFEKGCLIITVTSSSWATELHYFLPELRDKLRKDGGLYQLVSIKLKVVETKIEPTVKKRKKNLSNAAKEALQQIIEQCDYEPLREALSQLAE
ncbi:MAG: DUF721 domain-containing protein [Proteobacteria bacterium]|nr:DUF721 domain-containing protein [Pseudomonadota bacterium]